MLNNEYIIFCEQFGNAIKTYPNLKIAKNKEGVSFLKGIIDIPNDVNEIVGSFLIEIYLSEGFPYRFPVLFETGEEIPIEPNWHKNADGSCCITVKPDEILKCKTGISISIFIKEYAIPYFANYIHRKLTGKYKNGEYEHGQEGTTQFYEELFKTKNKEKWIEYFEKTFRSSKVACQRNDNCFCGIAKKYKDCHLEVFNKLRLIGEEQVINDLKNIIK